MFDLRPKYSGGNEGNGNLLQKVPYTHYCTRVPDPVAGHRQPTPLLETSGHSQATQGQSLVGSLLLSPGSWCTQGSLCALRESVFQFWWLYGGVNGDLFQESLCHIQVYCTKSPCPYGRPLLTHTFARDSQTQFWLSLCGVSGCLCPQGLFEPSEHLWWVRRLILKVVSYFKNVNFLISSMISGKFHEVIGHV